jgi:hypothetical protein
MVEAECQGRSSRARPSPNHRIVAPPSPPPTPAAPRSFLLPFTQPLGGASWFWACLSPTSAASLFAAALVNWERVAEGETPPPALFDRQRSQKRPGLAARKQHLSRAPPPPPHFLSPPPPPPPAPLCQQASPCARCGCPSPRTRPSPPATCCCCLPPTCRCSRGSRGTSTRRVTRGRHPGASPGASLVVSLGPGCRFRGRSSSTPDFCPPPRPHPHIHLAPKVLPKTYGQRLPLWFPLQPSYWRPGAAAGACEPGGAPEGREAAAAEPDNGAGPRAAAIAVRGLTKVFPAPGGGRVLALDGLSFNVRRGAVTALLGHNGAGKTTAIHVLTGEAARGATRENKAHALLSSRVKSRAGGAVSALTAPTSASRFFSLLPLPPRRRRAARHAAAHRGPRVGRGPRRRHPDGRDPPRPRRVPPVRHPLAPPDRARAPVDILGA